MKKKLSKSLLCVIAFLCCGTSNAISQKSWTFVIYMAAANDLHKSALLDLQKMTRVGSSANVNIIVYLTLQEDSKRKVTRKLYVEKGSLQQMGPDMVRDSGDIATLEEALQWACIDYPSDHMAVLLWGNGSGPLNRTQKVVSSKGVCYDFDTGNYLTDQDCVQALLWARDHLRYGKKFDIVAFDASFLASMEMAYTVSVCADYLVGPEEEVPGDGFQYDYIFNQLGTKFFDPLSCAQLMIGECSKEAAGVGCAVSVIDLNLLHLLADNCNAVAQILTSQLRGKNRTAVRSVIKKCVSSNNCVSFDQGVYVDLYQLYKNLLKNIAGLKLSKSIVMQFQHMLQKGIALFPAIVKDSSIRLSSKQIGGLSIYFSRHSIDPSYYGLYWTLQNPNWLNFLEAFLT